MERDTKKIWWIILGCMVGVIVALVVGIIIVKNLNQKPDEVVNTLSLVEQAQAEVDAMTPVDIPKAIEIYQSYLDLATTDDEKVELYTARIDYLTTYDLNKEYSKQAINDEIEIDNILQSGSSAIQVINALYYYGEYDELLDKYIYISDQRAEAEGADMSITETEG